ncbi:MAG: cob(I)yrinic acid a,c-diamide adenosyltransferase [Bacteroidales bacterium]|jgi:cob(I)alamin adenosyltransferase|nr:cob(I)yrinic acid a,c-diamide adenosyltransferase [Bacteroidales bacterium]
MNKIYTKTGDDGTTSLLGGDRISKSEPILDVYGTCDELNAHIGMLMAIETNPFLSEIQEKLFIMGAILATPKEKYEQYWNEILWEPFLKTIEKEIDIMNNDLNPIQSFLLPQGSLAIAQAHICRTVCRKLERKISHFCTQNNYFLLLLQITNRLSDYFFILARFLHKKKYIPEKYLKMR